MNGLNYVFVAMVFNYFVYLLNVFPSSYTSAPLDINGEINIDGVIESPSRDLEQGKIIFNGH